MQFLAGKENRWAIREKKPREIKAWGNPTTQLREDEASDTERNAYSIPMGWLNRRVSTKRVVTKADSWSWKNLLTRKRKRSWGVTRGGKGDCKKVVAG